MGWAAEAVAEWTAEIRPLYRVAGTALWPTERGGRVSVEPTMQGVPDSMAVKAGDAKPKPKPQLST